jgi:hypothetical protein
MIVSDLRYVLLAKSDAFKPPHSNIYDGEDRAFPLIRLHSMNLRFEVRIGKALLHLKRVFVYIALQGRCGPRCGIFVMQQNDSVSMTLSTPSPRYTIWGLFTQSFV